MTHSGRGEIRSGGRHNLCPSYHDSAFTSASTVMEKEVMNSGDVGMLNVARLN